MLNTLKLVHIDDDKVLGRIYQILIDDIPLLQMFREFESQYSSDINGAYIDVLSEQALRTSLCEDGARFMPLGCDCGVSECWFVTGQVSNFDQFVTWGRWENPYRSKREKKDEGLFWSYKEFPDIVFDAQQYQSALEQALA